MVLKRSQWRPGGSKWSPWGSETALNWKAGFGSTLRWCGSASLVRTVLCRFNGSTYTAIAWYDSWTPAWNGQKNIKPNSRRQHVFVGVADPGSGAFLTPGSGMINPDRISRANKPIFWVKTLKLFDGYPGSGMENIRIRDGKHSDPGWKTLDPGWKTFGSGMENIRIRDKHPGSNWSLPFFLIILCVTRRGSVGQPRGDPSPGDPHPLQQHDERQSLRGHRLRTGQRHLGNRGLGVLDELYYSAKPARRSSHTGPPRCT